MPKLVQISTSAVAVPVHANPLNPNVVSFQVTYFVYALDEEGNAWELVKPAGVAVGKWVPMTREFVMPDLNGSGPIRSTREA